MKQQRITQIDTVDEIGVNKDVLEGFPIEELLSFVIERLENEQNPTQEVVSALTRCKQAMKYIKKVV
jgi:hypothetical protein